MRWSATTGKYGGPVQKLKAGRSCRENYEHIKKKKTLPKPPGPGDLPRSGKLSPFGSNMARRFLTPDMVATGFDRCCKQTESASDSP
jgi:hypothetical protein